MRLTPQQIAIIRQATLDAFGTGSLVWLFGSRVDDGKRGGGIDLLVAPTREESESATLAHKLRFLGLLERQLGERKIDVIIKRFGDTRPIVQMAHETGARL